jgi:hypothetical protein
MELAQLKITEVSVYQRRLPNLTNQLAANTLLTSFTIAQYAF